MARGGRSPTEARRPLRSRALSVRCRCRGVVRTDGRSDDIGASADRSGIFPDVWIDHATASDAPNPNASLAGRGPTGAGGSPSPSENGSVTADGGAHARRSGRWYPSIPVVGQRSRRLEKRAAASIVASEPSSSYCTDRCRAAAVSIEVFAARSDALVAVGAPPVRTLDSRAPAEASRAIGGHC